MIQKISERLRENLLKRGHVDLPSPKRRLKKCPRIIQLMVLTINIVVVSLFCWRYWVSFSSKISPGSPNTSANSNKEFDLFCFPDIKSNESKWPVFIFIQLFALVDIISSLLYLKTLLESWLKCNCFRFCSYSEHFSPIYSFFIAFQSVWLEQISLSCIDPNSEAIFVNIDSFEGFLQTMLIIASLLCIFGLFLAENGFFCCIDKFWHEELKDNLKFLTAICQGLNVIILIIIWISKAIESRFDFGIKVVALAFIPLWWLIRVVEYILNILIYKEEEGSKQSPLTAVFEMTQIHVLGNKSQNNRYHTLGM